MDGQKEINITVNLNKLINGILVVGIIVTAFSAGAAWTRYQNKKSNNSNPAPATVTSRKPVLPTLAPVDIKNVDIKGEPYIGNDKAPVVMAYWLDFQCPFCRRFETQTLPVLIDKYVNKGKLKIVFKDFQFLGPDSQDAGLVEKAVWELYPKQYFKWHQAMYKNQDQENGGFGDLKSILEMIKKEIPEMDANKIAALIEKKKDEYQKEQDEDKREGKRFNITGTPGFVIGQQNIRGAQPTEVFIQIIESELSRKGNR